MIDIDFIYQFHRNTLAPFQRDGNGILGWFIKYPCIFHTVYFDAKSSIFWERFHSFSYKYLMLQSTSPRDVFISNIYPLWNKLLIVGKLKP